MKKWVKNRRLVFNLKNSMKNYKRMWRAQRDMRKHFESLFNTSVKELQFRLLQIDHLYNTLDEIEAMTNDNLAKGVVKNAKERHNLDKLIHARTLFDK